ncbi:mitotic cohesin complex [Histoplasma capsulatum]|uniref:Mitotic cohesin complex n=1 Tax=Ajellomyces capsulatus TaxID=5037 RepID=A0A8A1MC25_AJECA|nr:mitotic cohesin complex [Histoplasma capsulatum]
MPGRRAQIRVAEESQGGRSGNLNSFRRLPIPRVAHRRVAERPSGSAPHSRKTGMRTRTTRRMEEKAGLRP